MLFFTERNNLYICQNAVVFLYRSVLCILNLKLLMDNMLVEISSLCKKNEEMSFKKQFLLRIQMQKIVYVRQTLCLPLSIVKEP